MARARVVDAVGRVLGDRYRLLAPIGTGASAHVLEAEDVTLRRRVAVKLLHSALAEDEGFLRRFRAEARAAAALTHPNIMRVYDWGEDSDGPFLVLELLGGGSLRDLLDKGHRLSPSQALLVGLEAARGLDHAHRRGLVHRDIKPANLLFDDEGRLAIADFGLARALAEAAWTEPGGAVLGTARYASPEQVQGGSLDGRADVYSLALVLVESVTGQVPFAADTTIATLMARVGKDLVVPDALGPLVPILTAAGASDPEERPDSAGLVRRLDALARTLPEPAALPLAGRPGAAPRTVAAAPIADPTELGIKAGAATSATVAASSVFDGDAVVPLDDGAPRSRWRRPWVVAVLGLLIAALVAGGAYAATQVLVPSSVVPQLAGKDFIEARKAADAVDLGVAVTRVYREGTEPGLVLGQKPAAGASLKRNRDIRLVVSRGPPPVALPAIEGLTEEAATARLAEVGLKVGTVLRPYDAEVAKGTVIDAPTGSRPKGSTVDLTISNGPEPVTMPDLVGQAADDAMGRLRGLGLSPVREDAFSEDVPVGQVIATTPGPGKQAEARSQVTVTVSKGPERIAVPEVEGRSVREATAIIERAGLKVGDIQGNNKGDTVVFTDPPAGTKVKRATPVTLYVRRGDG
ncbi:MAG TPA: PASTA domain-containing protein [Acidimicrobiales bacterium]|nr:PASTA domain-containing protein [Acidimicrobiales bacterium]